MTLYMYALVDRRPEPRERLGRGLARQPLALVRVAGAFVVVERASARAPTPAAIVGHDRVVRRLARLCPAVLPLRFGSTAPDRAAVQALLEPVASRLDDAFARVRGAVQFTLRVSGRPRAPAEHHENAGPGTRWLGERMARHRLPEIDCVSDATRPFVRAARVERHDDASRIGTVYQLVAREDVGLWRAALTRSMAALPRGIRVTMTGPWPAWAFAELG